MTDVAEAPAHRKARGAFFTPPELAAYVTEWAVRSEEDSVLEPSCGEAAFLAAAAARLTELGAAEPLLHGHELHEPSALAASAHLRALGYRAEISVGDFFERAPNSLYDAVIGNPPYVRYQDFGGASRAASRQAALRAGVNLTKLASSWAAFTVHSARFVKPGGRLGLVLPAELLSVNYAAEVRSYLMRRFGTVRLVMFRDLVFPGVLEEVVLLLAEGDGGTTRMDLLQADDVASLIGSRCLPEVTTWRPSSASGKWTEALLPVEALDAMATVVARSGVSTLHTWGETTLGAVTGNNSYFAMRPSEVASAGIPRRDLVAISPPGSRHLRGLGFSRQAWEKMMAADSRVWLFRPSGDELEAASDQYRLRGENARVDLAYKCRVRSPWWRVPIVKPADLLLTYMNADTPRLSTNQAGVHHLNSVHGIYLHDAQRKLGRQFLPLASLNTLTMLCAETVGRSYGGGMLKLEPREADLLPLPSPALVEAVADGLASVRSKVARALGRRAVLDAVRLVDEVLLVRGLGLAVSDVEALEAGRAYLSSRRTARGKTAP